MATITGQDSYGLLDSSMAGQGGSVTGPRDLGFFGGSGFAKQEADTRRDVYGRKTTDVVTENNDVLTASEYLRQKAKVSAQASTGQRRPVTRPPPPPEKPMADKAVSQSDYYKKKYGAFYNPETVWETPARPAAAAKTTSAIVGTDRATQGDVELLQRAVDTELLRIQNLRSTAADMVSRANALDFLSSDLNDVLGQIRRNEIESGKEGQSGNGIPIRASDARTFLSTFKTATILPTLIDTTLSKEPWLENLAPVPAPTVATPAPAVAYAPATSAKEEEITMFDDVQNLKWQLDMMLNPAKYQTGEMAKRLTALEKRIIRYSLTDTPMPATLASGFREEIMKLKNSLQQ